MTGRKKRIFWSHPQLRDYRKPLFDLVNDKYEVKFFFQQRDQIPNTYDVIYGKQGIANRRLTIYDIVNLYKGVKGSDVFISSFLSSSHSIIGIIFAKILNKKVIIWEEISYFFKGFRYRFKYLCLKQIAKWVDAFFVLGKPQQLALQQLGVRAEKIFLANEYPGHIYHRIKGRKINSLDVESKKVILYLGRFVPVKGISYLLEAYSLLEMKYSNVLLLIAGHGPLERQLKEYAKSLEIKNIKFLGPITDVSEKKYLFETSNMVVVPSIIDKTGKLGIEGGPLVVVEALSVGTPVLGTNGLTSSTKFIRNGINGFVVSHSDSKALFNKMDEILKWGNDDGVRKRVMAEFNKIKGHRYQFEQMERAINFSLGGSHEKICFLVGYYPINKGGAEYQAYLLSQELREQFEIFYISVGHEKEEYIIDNGIKIYTVKGPAFFGFKDVYFLLKPKIFKILRREKPDLIYQRVAYSVTGIAAKYCQEHDCQLIWHIDSKPDVEMKKLSISKRILVDYFEKKYLEFGIKNANCIIGQEDYHNEMLVRNFGKECTVILNKFLPVERKQVVKVLPIRVLWIANIKPLKQAELFIDLAYQFKDDDSVSFIMIGRSATGNYQAKLEKRMQRLINLEYKGELPIDKVNDLLRESHLFVNTSLYEGGPPITFIQAWMREVPTVSLNVDPDDMIKKNKLGFHSGSFEQMVKDVRFLIENKKVRGEMGRNARKYALREYDIKKIVPKYVELFERTVKQ